MNEHTGGPFIYSALGGITCAICAPAYTAAEEIELFAYLRLGATKDALQMTRAVEQEILIPPGFFCTSLSFRGNRIATSPTGGIVARDLVVDLATGA